LVAKRPLTPHTKHKTHTHCNQLEPPPPYPQPQRLCPLPPWVDQRCHQHMAPSLTMVPCKALAVRFGGAMVGLFALVAICHHIQKLRDMSLALGDHCLMMTHNNQPKVNFCSKGDVREEAQRGRSVWGDAVPSFMPSN
jgi:hypothetical protein